MTTLPKPPITAQDVPDSWVAACRQAASVREGVALRPNPIDRTIEAYSINYRKFIPLMLPGGGTEFATDADVAAVWGRLEGK